METFKEWSRIYPPEIARMIVVYSCCIVVVYSCCIVVVAVIQELQSDDFLQEIFANLAAISLFLWTILFPFQCVWITITAISHS
jgi:hypothetical protein